MSSGYLSETGTSCAELMRDHFVRMGVGAARFWTELESRSTYENAVECRNLLGRLGIRKVILVTEAWHMRRALSCFEKQGVEVVPSPCHHRATEIGRSIFDFLPTPRSVPGSYDALHEWVGLAWYRLCGRI